ncbi:MAG: hypothetical protein KC502_02130 [Myxococcales bacterium]|nr:hypothetical protein [Myxococcales bacterium]
MLAQSQPVVPSPSRALRWASALSDGVAMVSGDVGVVAARLPSGAVGIARFPAPDSGFWGPWSLVTAAENARQHLKRGPPSAFSASPIVAKGSRLRALLPLATWLLMPPILVWIWATQPWEGASRPMVIGLTAVVLRLVGRLAPWIVQSLRVAVGRPTLRQRLHAAEHEHTGPLTCGAAMLLTTSFAASLVELSLLLLLLIDTTGTAGGAATHNPLLVAPMVWAPFVSAPICLVLVGWRVSLGKALPGWTETLASVARPEPEAAELEIAGAAYAALLGRGLPDSDAD